MPRTSKPAERRKDEILDAAQHLFTTKGFQATTVEDVLVAVGIAKGTLYYHFAGKDEVLRGLILRTVNRMADQAKAIAEGDGPAVEKFFAVLAATRVDGQDAELVGEFHAPGNAEFHLMSIVETVRRLTPILAEIVAEGVEEGAFTTDQPRETVEILLTSGGLLLDEGIIPGDAADMQRRTLGVVRAAERLLGCPEGTLGSIAGRRA